MKTISGKQFHKAVNNIESVLTPILQKNGFSWKFIAGSGIHTNFCVNEVASKNTPAQRVRGAVGLMGEIINLKTPEKRILVQPFYIPDIFVRIDRPNSNIPSSFINKWKESPELLKLKWYEFLSSVNLYFLLYNERYFVLHKYDAYPESSFALKYRYNNTKLDRMYLKQNDIPARSLKYLQNILNKLIG